MPLDHATKIIGENGNVEILRIITVEEIIPKGIPYVKYLMKDLEIQQPGPYIWFILETFCENLDKYF